MSDAIVAFLEEFLLRVIGRLAWIVLAAAAIAGVANALVGRLCDRIFGGRR